MYFVAYQILIRFNWGLFISKFQFWYTTRYGSLYIRYRTSELFLESDFKCKNGIQFLAPLTLGQIQYLDLNCWNGHSHGFQIDMS